MTKSFTLGQHTVGPDHPPFIIAEMSGNHNQSLSHALALVEVASNCGAHAIKLQTYTPDTLTLNSSKSDFFIQNPSSLWSGQTLHELYSKSYTPWEWHVPLFERAKQLGLVCFSSPFDETAVDFLELLGTPAYKIASFENNYLALIKKAASTGKPLIISTGMSSLADLERAVSCARDHGCKDLILLKCTSAYPASPLDANIRTIPHLSSLFNCQVGLSDHTPGIGVAIASISLGATIVEKHFTSSRADGGVDSEFSLEPNELTGLVQESFRAWQSLGTVSYRLSSDEVDNLVFRRSIYVSKDICKGDYFTTDNIRIVRPGYGASPHLYDTFIGKVAQKNFSAGTPLTIDSLF